MNFTHKITMCCIIIILITISLTYLIVRMTQHEPKQILIDELYKTNLRINSHQKSNLQKDTNKVKKLKAYKKYLKKVLNKPYDETPININIDNKSNICIIMTGDEKIFPFYGNSIDINSSYAQTMGYDFKSVVGRTLDKSKYMPHFDRYKLILDLMTNKDYEYILYVDSDAIIQDLDTKIEHFVNMMTQTDFLLASWDCGRTAKTERTLGINSGVLLIKNCQTSINFCKDILTTQPDCYLKRCKCVGTQPCKFYDQCVIDRLNKYHKNIKLLTYGILQIFPRNINKCSGEIDISQKSFIYHLSGLDKDTRSDYLSKYNKKNTIKNIKISVYILNFKRPHNISIQIDSLINNPYIDEIIICNGHPDHIYEKTTTNPKIVIENDFDNEFYTARRWISIPTCKNEFVLNLDDDVIPSEKLIEDLIYNINKNSMTIYGPMKRRCNNKGYIHNPTKNNYNTILTPILMTSKTLITNFLNSPQGLPNHIQWIKDHKGNCEDLSINMYLNKIGIKPVWIDGEYTKLDQTNGFSSNPQHSKVRAEFCKKYI